MINEINEEVTVDETEVMGDGFQPEPVEEVVEEGPVEEVVEEGPVEEEPVTE